MAFKLSLNRGLLPILAFGAPLVAIALVQYRWLIELQGRSEMIETHRNREAAQQARSLLADEMTRARLTILPPVGHGDLIALELEPIAQLFATGHQRFDYIDRFFVWTEAMPQGEAWFYQPDGGGFAPDPGRLACLPEVIWTLQEGKGRWGEFLCVGDEPPCQVVIHRILDDEENALLAFAGFTVDRDRFAREFLPEFAARVLTPAVQDLFEDRRVATPLTLVDESDELLFGTDGGRSASASTVELPVTFTLPSEGLQSAPVGRWRLSVGSSDAGGLQQILRRGALGNIAIVGAGLIVLALGSALMARSSAREAKLSDLKSRFISGISHELKTPLSNMRLYSEMLELGRVRSVERKLFYRSLRQQAEILGAMLEEILDFSRLEAEQVTRFEPCDLRDIVEEAVEMGDWARTPGLVDVKLPDALPLLRGNRSALVRAVFSLLDNASKYSGADEPITLEAHQRDGTMAIEVADRGVGISPEDLPHVFERFYRGRSSGDVKGAGLGLSIAQSVATSHGGRIEVESEPGRGSRFTVLLPLASEGG